MSRFPCADLHQLSTSTGTASASAESVDEVADDDLLAHVLALSQQEYVDAAHATTTEETTKGVHEETMEVVEQRPSTSREQ